MGVIEGDPSFEMAITIEERLAILRNQPQTPERDAEIAALEQGIRAKGSFRGANFRHGGGSLG